MSLLSTPEAFASTRFDYLIAGGGTAGLVLANRLTEIPTVSVGVIEAGGDLTNDMRVLTPLGMFDMLGRPEYDWGFVSEPQEALNGLRVPQGRGKMLGGSSGINFMQMTYASQADLDDWEKLGNSGWNYASLAPYYKKFEDYQGAPAQIHALGFDSYVDAAVHGYGGPINESLTPYYLPIQAAWVPTLTNMGLGANGDPRDGKAIGAYNNPMPMTLGSSQRSFAGNSYWKPYASRPNFHVIAGAVVRNIIFSNNRDGDLIATGLNFTANGTSYIANASTEVIVSGGTMKSPQILELSGIGSKKILSQVGIETLIDNPNVGENFQDHPQCGLQFEANPGEPEFSEYFNETRYKYWQQIFEANGTGLLAGGNGHTAQLSWNQILGPAQQSRPRDLVKQFSNQSIANTSIYYSPSLSAQHALTVAKLLDPTECAMQQSSSAGGGNGSITGFVAHPFSRGYIHINSSNMDDDPLFDPRYLSHPLDYELLKDIQFFATNVSTTAPMSTHFVDGGRKFGGLMTELNDDTVRKLINTAFITGWHVVGSCAMGPRDQGGVVDTNLKVYGTKNLRIIDASIVPLLPRGNTMSLVYAVAEKAADMIKADRNSTQSGSSVKAFTSSAARWSVNWMFASLATLVISVWIL